MTEAKKWPESQPQDDVATLYSWANLHGSKYRDFSSGRQEERAKARHRSQQQDAQKQELQPPASAVPAPAAEQPVAPARLVMPSPPIAAQSIYAAIQPLAAPMPASLHTYAAARPQPEPLPQSEPMQGQADCASWLAPASLQQPQPPAADLQGTHVQVASRWYALKGIFDPNEAAQPDQHRSAVAAPSLAVFSLAGGVGKTSLVATLGRALASRGERVFLADTNAYGLLPFYYGGVNGQPGQVRTFSGSPTEAPVQMVTLDAESYLSRVEDPGGAALVRDLMRDARGAHRLMIDVVTGSVALARRLFALKPTVLVPIMADMSSVATIRAVESFFQGHPEIRPLYLLNQFDSALPLHLDVREVLRQQLGDRLLPFTIRHSSAVSEALAEGMTVVDYAAGSPVTEDYMRLASWLRSFAAPVTAGMRSARWSER